MVDQLKNNPAAVQGSISYLLTMITQVLLFCWIGNELIYSVSFDLEILFA